MVRAGGRGRRGRRGCCLDGPRRLGRRAGRVGGVALGYVVVGDGCLLGVAVAAFGAAGLGVAEHIVDGLGGVKLVVAGLAGSEPGGVVVGCGVLAALAEEG